MLNYPIRFNVDTFLNQLPIMIYMSSNTHNVPKENIKLFAKINLLQQIIAPQKLHVYLLGRYYTSLNYIFMYKL